VLGPLAQGMKAVLPRAVYGEDGNRSYFCNIVAFMLKSKVTEKFEIQN